MNRVSLSIYLRSDILPFSSASTIFPTLPIKKMHIQCGETLRFSSLTGLTVTLLQGVWMTSQQQYVLLVLFVYDRILHGNYRLPIGGVLCLQESSQQ